MSGLHCTRLFVTAGTAPPPEQRRRRRRSACDPPCDRLGVATVTAGALEAAPPRPVRPQPAVYTYLLADAGAATSAACGFGAAGPTSRISESTFRPVKSRSHDKSPCPHRRLTIITILLSATCGSGPVRVRRRRPGALAVYAGLALRARRDMIVGDAISRYRDVAVRDVSPH